MSATFFFLNSLPCTDGYRWYASFVHNIPNPAPKNTSPSQCLLLYTRNAPVPAAITYPPIPYHGEMSLYSCLRNSAPMNAIAVCPDGNEFRLAPSGRCF